MVLQFFADYLKHQFTAKTRHGTHSPFVYKLADEVIYNFSAKNDYKAIEAQRKQLLNDQRLVTVIDLGAGSQLNKNRTKKVAQIAKNALKSPRLAQLIYRLAANHQPSNIIIDIFHYMEYEFHLYQHINQSILELYEQLVISFHIQ